MSIVSGRILLIEDDPGDIELIEKMLRDSDPSSFQLEKTRNLKAGLARLLECDIDVVLLDLGLPDSTGLATVAKVCTPFPEIPVVVLTGHGDESSGLQALQSGAQDYLLKDQLDPGSLLRAIRYAIERNRQQMEVERARENTRDTVLQSLDRLSGAYTIVTASCQPDPLRSRVPDVFEELVTRYAELVEMALTERIFKEDHSVSRRLRAMVQRMGFFHTGARDVIEIFGECVKRELPRQSEKRYRLFLEEARFVLLEVMGRLISLYLDCYLRCTEPSTSE